MTKSDTNVAALFVLVSCMAIIALSLGLTAWLAGANTDWEHVGFGIYAIFGGRAMRSFANMLSSPMHMRRRIIHGLLLAVLLLIAIHLGRESELSWWATLGIPGGALVGGSYIIARKALQGLYLLERARLLGDSP